MAKKYKARILLLEDDLELQELIVSYYKPRGFEVICFEDPSTPLAELQGAREPDSLYDLVISDLKMPKIDGMELIRKLKPIAPRIPIILMTAHSSVEVALKATYTGAYDFVVKPLHFPQLTISIERALHLRQLQAENQNLRSQVKGSAVLEGVIVKSPSMKALFDLAKRVSSSTATVLITGESGTGKEILAKTIHQMGSRKKGPFVAINCSAIPENLLESELFGYAKGAFTGAAEKKLGLFEEAEEGTLFLDEIGDLSLPLQAKLLRVLQERKIKRLGENQFRSINIRLLAATHKNLMTEVQEEKFREDLFFRLNVIPIRIPSLRERKEDIIPLAEHFVSKFSVQNNSIARSVSKAGLDHLLKLPWRGNVRELENAIERAVVLCDEREIGVKDLPSLPGTDMNTTLAPSTAPLVKENSNTPIKTPQTLLNTIRQREDLPSLNTVVLEYVSLVLSRVNGVKEQAARILEVDRKTLYRRIHELEKTNQPKILQ